MRFQEKNATQAIINGWAVGFSILAYFKADNISTHYLWIPPLIAFIITFISMLEKDES